VDDDPRQRAGWRGREWIVIDWHKLRRGGCSRRGIGRLRGRPDRKRIMVDRNQLERRIGERVVIDRDEIKHGSPRDISPAGWDRPRRCNRARVTGLR
jgi:hypothetical protein